MEELIGAKIDRSNNFTLQKILDLRAPDFAEEIAGRGLHSFAFPLILSLLCPFPLNSS